MSRKRERLIGDAYDLVDLEPPDEPKAPIPTRKTSITEQEG